MEQPTYKDLFQNINSQLSQRAGLLAKRVLLVGWPALIFIVLDSIFKFNNQTSFSILFFILIYAVILGHIFSTEKIIWIDSYFDGKNLQPKESFLIAKKLFWPTTSLRFLLFFRYFLFPFILYVSLWPIFLLNQDITFCGMMVYFWPLLGLGILALYWLYIDIKLRYIWFIFLDNYGKSDFSYKNLFKQMNELNQVNKLDSFKKSLAVNLGADFVENLIQFPLFKRISSIFRKSEGGTNNVVSTYSSGFIGEMSRLAKIVANYVLYRYSREQLYKEPQIINENIYSLLK